MLNIYTKNYIISINLQYILREIDIREDEDASGRTAEQLYVRIIENLFWAEMEEEGVISYKLNTYEHHPEEQFFEKPKKLEIQY